MSSTVEVPFEGGNTPDYPEQKTFLESLPYYLGRVHEVEVTDDKVIIRQVPPGEEQHVIEATTQCLAHASAEHERFEEKTLSSFSGNYTLGEGVYEELKQRGGILPSALGKVAYSGDVARVFAAFDGFIQNQCFAMGAQPEIYPTALEGKSLLRAGYFNTFAQHAYFIAPLQTSLEALQAAKDGSVIDASDEQQANENLQAPQWVLSPTVCHHCFEARKDSVIELPLKVTALNQCSRYEVHGTRGLERLRIYWMREYVHYAADEKTVVESLDQLLAFMIEALTRWGISHEVVTASDPFFANSATSKRVFQNIFSLKRELKLPIPGGSLACASFNNHQGSLVDTFGMQAQGDSSITSGCVAWGYDRFIYSLFVQLGVELDDWPQAVRDDLGL